MWSDPEDIENWAVSPRGAGWLFGGNITQQVRYKLSTFGLFSLLGSLIIQTH
jgi:diadenosine tetraphosphatase ApaH/serine/threonine PP2A family protein phosphatase